VLEQLTEPDEQISADDMETLSLKLLSQLPMKGVEGSPLDADVIWKTVERAATDTTSVHHVVLVVRWTVVARPRQGGRDLPTEFTFELVYGWIRDHLSADLGWQYTWETNGVGLPPSHDPASGLTEVRPLACLS
jgi:hypothetical protein